MINNFPYKFAEVKVDVTPAYAKLGPYTEPFAKLEPYMFPGIYGTHIGNNIGNFFRECIQHIGFIITTEIFNYVINENMLTMYPLHPFKYIAQGIANLLYSTSSTGDPKSEGVNERKTWPFCIAFSVSLNSLFFSPNLFISSSYSVL